MKKGFTLVELLISIALMTIIGTVTVAMISTVLRSSKNTTLAGDIRQSGNYVTEQISDTVRYATDFKLGIGANPLDTTDSSTYTRDCSTTITSHYLALTTNNDEKVFYCDSTANAIDFREATSASYSPLIDTSTVSVTNCSFTCSQASAGAPPTISISFTASHPGNFSENNVSMPFSTSTLMRNINN